MARGRKPQPCPSYDELRRLYAEDGRITILAAKFNASSKAVIRWLGEVGIRYETKDVRPRGSAPAGYVRIAKRSSDGKRISPKLYNVWHAMRVRCSTPGDKDYVRYGARGIRVCDEWQDYDVFRAWAISHGYGKGLTLDRIDSNGHYEPGNCRWIPKGKQQLNTRRTIQITANGVTRPLPEWSDLTGLTRETIRTRLRKGWSQLHAVTIPAGAIPKGRGRGIKHFLSSEDAGA